MPIKIVVPTPPPPMVLPVYIDLQPGGVIPQYMRLEM